MDKEVLKLRNEGGVGYGRVPLDQFNDVASKVGVTPCKLVCKSGKDVFELLSVRVISGTEKASTKDPLLCNHF